MEYFGDDGGFLGMMTAATTNFERPFTPQTWLRSVRNFDNARFGRFVTFDFSTSKFFFTEKKSDFFLVFFFSLFSTDFPGARLFLTSKSNSSRFFALTS